MGRLTRFQRRVLKPRVPRFQSRIISEVEDCATIRGAIVARNFVSNQWLMLELQNSGYDDIIALNTISTYICTWIPTHPLPVQLTTQIRVVICNLFGRLGTRRFLILSEKSMHNQSKLP